MSDEYAEFRDGPGDNLLKSIASKAREQIEQEAEVARIEEELTKAKDKLRIISEIEMPELMDAAEQTEIKTKDGIKVSMKEKIRATISKSDPERAARAFKWLEENKHDRLIKRTFTIQFGMDDEKWANKFEGDLKKRKKQLNVKREKAVHNASLVSFVKEMLEKGVDFPQDAFGVFRQKFSSVQLDD